VGGGGFLFWRINQEDTVAPDGSDAADAKCDVGYWLPNSPTEYYCINGVDSVKGSDVAEGCYQGYYDENLGHNCWKKVSTPTPVTKYTLKYIAGTGGSITGSATQTVEKGKSGSQVTAVADAGYTFIKWSDGKTSASRTDSNVQSNITVTAEFEADASEYTLTYTAGAGGTISGTSPQTVSEGEDGTAVTAVPNNGYKFTQWSDKTTTNPRKDTNVTNNISVTAQFSELAANEYTLTYIAGDNGSITGDTTQTVEEGEDGTTVTAIANSGYRFSKWSDGVATANRTDMNINSNITVTAQFSAVVSSNGTVPETGIFDSVLGKVSLGISFIFLGGLVSQYSKINYLFNSLTERSRFRQEIRKQKRVAKHRRKLEDKFK
jgi:hypothetical protein